MARAGPRQAPNQPRVGGTAKEPARRSENAEAHLELDFGERKFRRFRKFRKIPVRKIDGSRHSLQTGAASLVEL